MFCGAYFRLQVFKAPASLWGWHVDDSGVVATVHCSVVMSVCMCVCVSEGAAACVRSRSYIAVQCSSHCRWRHVVSAAN